MKYAVSRVVVLMVLMMHGWCISGEEIVFSQGTSEYAPRARMQDRMGKLASLRDASERLARAAAPDGDVPVPSTAYDNQGAPNTAGFGEDVLLTDDRKDDARGLDDSVSGDTAQKSLADLDENVSEPITEQSAEQIHAITAFADATVNELKRGLGAASVAALEAQRPGIFERIRSFIFDYVRLLYMRASVFGRLGNMALPDIIKLDKFSDALDVIMAKQGSAGVTASIADSLFTERMTKHLTKRLAQASALKQDIAAAEKVIDSLRVTYPDKARIQTKVWGKLEAKVVAYETAVRIAYNTSKIANLAPSLSAFVHDDAAGFIEFLSGAKQSGAERGVAGVSAAALERLRTFDGADLAQRSQQIMHDQAVVQKALDTPGIIADEDRLYWQATTKVLAAYGKAVEQTALLKQVDAVAPSLSSFMQTDAGNIVEYLTGVTRSGVQTSGEGVVSALTSQVTTLDTAALQKRRKAIAQDLDRVKAMSATDNPAYWAKVHKVLVGYDQAVESLILMQKTTALPSLQHIIQEMQIDDVRAFVQAVRSDDSNMANLLGSLVGTMYGKDPAAIKSRLTSVDNDIKKIVALRQASTDPFEVAYWTKLEKLLTAYTKAADPMIKFQAVAQTVASAEKKMNSFKNALTPSSVAEDKLMFERANTLFEQGKKMPGLMTQGEVYVNIRDDQQSVRKRNNLDIMKTNKQSVFEYLVAQDPAQLAVLREQVTSDREVAKQLKAQLASRQKDLKKAGTLKELAAMTSDLDDDLKAYGKLIDLAVDVKKGTVTSKPRMVTAGVKAPKSGVIVPSLAQF